MTARPARPAILVVGVQTPYIDVVFGSLMLKFIYESSPARIRRGFNLAGITILLVGLVAALVVWHDSSGEQQSAADPNNPATALAPSDSARQSRQIEIYYGKSGLLFERWSEKAQILLHGRPLARLIAFAALMAETGCFLIARRIHV